MKKKVLIGLAVFAAAALLAAGVWAWFTATAEAETNEFTAGTVAIALHDEFAEDGIVNWNPGDCAEKEVYVENTGTLDAYVRVKLTPEWEDGLSNENVTWVVGSNWYLHEGWYYYKLVLPGSVNAQTSPLISEVCLDGEKTDNDYQGAKLTIKVEAEAVQASHDAYKDMWNLSGLPW